MIHYYKNTNEAEMAIVNEQYEEANLKYKTAFNHYGGIRFAKDLHNAFYAALYAKDTSLSVFYLDSFAFYGAHKSGFINLYHSNHSLQSKLEKQYDAVQAIGKQHLDWAMIKVCDSFAVEDQKIRERFRGDESKEANKEFRRLDSINFFSFLAYVDQNGFPSFQKIGFSSRESADPKFTNVFYLLLWHQRTNTFPDSVENKLKGMVHQAYVLPYDYTICRFNQYAHYGFIPLADLSATALETINANRNFIYMDSADDFKAKMKKSFKVDGTSVVKQIPFIFYNIFTFPSYELR